MARVVEITVPPERTEELLAAIGKLELTAGIQVERGKSLKPSGDVITVQIANRTTSELHRILARRGIGIEKGTSYSVSEPVALMSSTVNETLLWESTDAGWEEMHQVLARESNMTVNALLLMATAGFLALIGISTGTLHLVIAAMVIAPGFEPLSRIALGLVAGGRALARGALDSAKGYLALLAGGSIAALLLELLGKDVTTSSGTYLSPQSLVTYWSTVEPTSVLVSLFAATAGGILIATDRTVLTAGVMIGLALIPSASLSAAALVEGDLQLLGNSLLRLLTDAALVVFASSLVFIWKRRSKHPRPSQL